MKFFIPLLLFFMLVGRVSAAEAQPAPATLATIKPVHSLMAVLLQGIGQPELLIDGYTSPHTFQLRPGDADKVARADIIVWVGPTMETALRNILARGGRDGQLVIRLAEGEEGHDEDHHGHHDEHHDEHHDDHDDHHDERHGDHDGHHDEHHDEDHDDHHDGHHDDDHHGETHLHEDPHRWLDPVLALADMRRVAAAIGARHPELAPQLNKNLAALEQRLTRLDKDIRATLAGRAVIPALAYHDAWGYFEERYGLRMHGVVNPGAHGQPSARRIHTLGEIARQRQTRCLLLEPQFKPRYLAQFTATHNLDAITLDPLGAELPAGEELYFQLMRRVADGLAQCR